RKTAPQTRQTTWSSEIACRGSRRNASNAAPVIKGCLPAIYPYGSIDRDMGGSLVVPTLGRQRVGDDITNRPGASEAGDDGREPDATMRPPEHEQVAEPKTQHGTLFAGPTRRFRWLT